MTTPYVGEIRLFGGNFAPEGWFLCAGQTLPISEYVDLFNLIGTTYGGDGETTFQLPDLQGRMPVHAGTGYALGQRAGVEQVTLTEQQLPAHEHELRAGGSATSSAPAGNFPAAWSGVPYAASGSPTVALAATAVSPAGGSLPHDNMPPFLAINYIIAFAGTYPTTS